MSRWDSWTQEAAAMVSEDRPDVLICLLLVICSSSWLRFVAPRNVSLQGCPSSCGNLTIPYPFGIGNDCAREGFDLSCNHSFASPKTFISTGTVEVLNISLHQAQAWVSYYRAYDCYQKNGSGNSSSTPQAWAGDTTPYTFSNIHNKFTVLGCDTYAYMYGYNDTGIRLGCDASCSRWEQVVNDNGSCSGLGCCQISIPKGLKYFGIEDGSCSTALRAARFPFPRASSSSRSWSTAGTTTLRSGALTHAATPSWWTRIGSLFVLRISPTTPFTITLRRRCRWCWTGLPGTSRAKSQKQTGINMLAGVKTACATTPIAAPPDIFATAQKDTRGTLTFPEDAKILMNAKFQIYAKKAGFVLTMLETTTVLALLVQLRAKETIIVSEIILEKYSIRKLLAVTGNWSSCSWTSWTLGP